MVLPSCLLVVLTLDEDGRLVGGLSGILDERDDDLGIPLLAVAAARLGLVL